MAKVRRRAIRKCVGRLRVLSGPRRCADDHPCPDGRPRYRRSPLGRGVPVHRIYKMNTHEIESAIEHAINALSLAKLALSKSALPIFNESDIIRKVDHVEPKDDAASRALAAL